MKNSLYIITLFSSFIIISSIILLSCGNSIKKSKENKSEIHLYDNKQTAETDSNNMGDDAKSFEFKPIIQGKRYSFYTSLGTINYLVDFQTFIKNYEESMLYQHKINIDVTGDEKLNLCITQIEMKNEDAFAINTIFSDNQKIWIDTFLVTRKKIEFLWYDDIEILDSIEPWLLLYIAYKIAKDFIKDFDYINTSDEFIWEHFLNRMEESGGNRDDLELYLHNYKGKIIIKMCHWAPSLNIWHPYAKEFIEIWAP
jgi:hypothetical protein